MSHAASLSRHAGEHLDAIERFHRRTSSRARTAPDSRRAPCEECAPVPDPATLPISRFLSHQEIVESDVQHAASLGDGHQHIEVDVEVHYPTGPSYGAGRNRIYVKS